MTVFEMHIQLNQRLQEIASYKRGKFKPQELDMVLNKAMFRLLERGVASKFEDDQINLSHVRALIQKRYAADIIIPEITDALYEDNLLTGYVVLPPDLFWLINNRIEAITDPLNCDIAPSLATTTYNEYVVPVVYPTPPGSDVAPYFDNVNISSTTQGILYVSPTEIASGFPSQNSQYVVINNILEKLTKNKPAVKVYWERYRDTYYQNTLIFVSLISLGTVTISSGGQANSTTGAAPLVNKVYNRSLISALPSKTVTTTSTRTTNEEELYDALSQNVFYKTRVIEPTIVQTQDYLVFYRDISFIITRSYTDYIRKPRTISLLLNQSCELAEPTHPRLIDLAVEIVRLDTKDPTYQLTVADTQTRTT